MGVGCFAQKRGGGRKNAFFEFFLRRLSTTPTPGSPHMPQRWRPQPNAPGTTAHDRQQGRPCQNQGGQVPGQTMQDTTHAQTLDTLHRSALDTRQIAPAAGAGGRAGSASIMRIVIALSQAWYIDSNMNKYHKDILLFLVIVNCYLSIDIQPY